MKRSERTRILLKIVERLAADEWPTIDLILGQYDGKRSDDWQGTKAAYVGWSIERISDDALEDLAEFLGLANKDTNSRASELGVVEASEVRRLWGEAPSFRLFLSHISASKVATVALKQALVEFGISAFVAHADIQPTKEWLEEILRALRTMDALAAILVPEFHASNWTDQEVGFAIARGVPVVPLKDGQDPYGFIGRFQALNCSRLAPHQIATQISRLLIENPSCQTSMAEAVARRLALAPSYAASRSLIELLEIPSKLPEATLDIIAKAENDNSQVKGSWGVSERISSIFARHSFTRRSPKTAHEEIPF